MKTLANKPKPRLKYKQVPRTTDFVKPRGRVFWRCSQVEYSIHHTQIKLGMKVGFCLDAMRESGAATVPDESKFVRGKITKLEGDLMTITWDNPAAAGGSVNITCGVVAYACYCIPAD